MIDRFPNWVPTSLDFSEMGFGIAEPLKLFFIETLSQLIKISSLSKEQRSVGKEGVLLTT